MGWHDDNYFFGLTRSHTVSAVVYLRDTNSASGCLRVVPGSHLDAKVGTDRASFYVPHPKFCTNYISEEAVMSGPLSRDRHGKRRMPIDVGVPAGSAVVFDANLVRAPSPAPACPARVLTTTRPDLQNFCSCVWLCARGSCMRPIPIALQARRSVSPSTTSRAISEPSALGLSASHAATLQIGI